MPYYSFYFTDSHLYTGNVLASLYLKNWAGRNPSAMQEMWAQSLGWEDPLEEEMTTHSSILT